MSVAGIDFGNEYCVASVAKRGGIETVLNESSNRKNPSIVSFQGKERLSSDQAKAIARPNWKNTISDIRLLLGKKWADPDVQNDIARLPNKTFFQETTDGGIGIKVQYGEDKLLLRPEDAAAMMITKVLDVVSDASSGRAVTDLVITVPGYYTEHERGAMLNAARIAGVEPLALINENTAVALDFGIWKDARQLFDKEKEQYHMFVNIGHTSTSVAVVAYVEKKMRVLSAEYDRHLGGRDIDYALLDIFSEDFKNKNGGLDPRSNPKAALKLLEACTKAKQTLTPEGVKIAKANVEFLLEERDFHYTLELDEFEKVCEPFAARVFQVVSKALESSKLSHEQIATVEIIGGSSRVRSFKRAIAEAMKLDVSKPNFGLSTTLNADESASRGAALRAAMLSPSFRAITYEIIDYVPYSIRLTWNQTAVDSSTNDPNSMEVDTVRNASLLIFQRGDSTPQTRRITFNRSEPFEIVAEYDESSAPLLPVNGEKVIGKFKVNNLPPPSGNGKAHKIRVEFRHDESGFLRCVSATCLKESEPEEDTPEAPSTPNHEQTASTEANGNGNGNGGEQNDEEMKDENGNPIDAKDTAQEGDKTRTEEEPKSKKKKMTKIQLDIQSELMGTLQGADLSNAIERERNFKAQDRIIKETANAQNALEEHVLQFRNRLDEELSSFASQQEKDNIKKDLMEAEEWLYNEGSDATRDQYIAKLRDLQASSNPIQFRFTESTDRNRAASALKGDIENYLSVVNSDAEMYSHLSDEDRDSVRGACNQAIKWLESEMGAQEKLPLSDDPKVTSFQIQEKAQELSKLCRPIVTKKKPAPKKETKKADEKEKGKGKGKGKESDKEGAEAGTEEAAPEDVQDNGDAQPELATTPEPGKEGMDLD